MPLVVPSGFMFWWQPGVECPTPGCNPHCWVTCSIPFMLNGERRCPHIVIPKAKLRYPNQPKSCCREQHDAKLRSCLDWVTQGVPEIQHLCDFEVAKANLIYALHWLPHSVHQRWLNCISAIKNDRIQFVAAECHEAGETHPARKLSKPQQLCPGRAQKQSFKQLRIALPEVWGLQGIPSI